MLLFRHAFCPRGGRVRVHAVAATVHRRDGDINQLPGEWIESARLDHDLLDIGPRALQHWRLIGQRPPEVVHKVGLAGGAYVVEEPL